MLAIAHIREDDKAEQLLWEHCRKTADISARHASAIGAASIGELQGLLHDAGKGTTMFQKYIRQEVRLRRGSIDHSFAGAKYISQLVGVECDKDLAEVARIIEHTIVSHHGIHDWLETGKYSDYLAERLRKTEYYEEAIDYLNSIATKDRLLKMLEDSAKEYSEIKKRIKELLPREAAKGVKRKTFSFYIGMIERFLESCLIDADRTNTADFMGGIDTELSYDQRKVWQDIANRLQAKYENFQKKDDPVSLQRCKIAQKCEKFASQKVSVCRLIVPTGGGKTLSSLRFAVNYCKNFDKKKIIYVAPYMSILEQNSDVFREVVGNEYFTEHHSNVFSEIESDEELHEYELRTEKWDAPVIATTMVQFLNALFSSKSSAVRRMHRLSGAVLIIDEVQSIPLKCVNLFNLACNFLSRICGSVVVLCSATQPTMEHTDFPLLLDENDSMTGDVTEDFNVLKRARVISQVDPYGFTYADAANFCSKVFAENGNLLCVVNTKASAKKMFSLIKEICPNVTAIHLSTNLCPAHRKDKIDDMKKLLAENKPIICVTTQLIEAGVDISFRTVVRSLAGLDNVAQAAGRCNRNGESDGIRPVYIIKLREENLLRLQDIQDAQTITQQILAIPEFTDYLDDKVQREYFKKLFNMKEDKLSYPVKIDGLETNLLELLSTNKKYFDISGIDKSLWPFVQAFKTAGSLFQVIDNNTHDVLVPYNEDAENIILELNGSISMHRSRELMRRAGRYMVSVYDGQRRNLDEQTAIYMLPTGVYALQKSFYDPDFGITTDGAMQEIYIY